jgi:TRAP-type uncharacterized transport system fused permease subunit
VTGPETGIEAFSLSLNKAIVPFAFVRTPGLVRLRREPNAAELEIGEKYRVLGAADLFDLAYLVPGVLIPVVCLFLGVVGIGSGGGDEVSLAVDLALRGVGLALFVALLLGNRGQGASGLVRSSGTETAV